jgi:transketolase
VPAEILKAWRAAGAHAKGVHADWNKRINELDRGKRAEFDRRIKGDLPKQALADAVRALKEKLAAQPKEIATRNASELALESLIPALPEMIGGSADLTGSNNTAWLQP